ncbi:MAG: glycosyltransferase [Cyanobacteria bacterium P01_D01_bin.105]
MVQSNVSLYIPCYNVSRFIEGCIQGVLGQTYTVDEILVVDDGSQDNTLALAKQYPVKIIQHSSNKGLAAARNTAFRAAKNEFVASLDADCVPSPDWLSTLMPLMMENDVGAVGGKLIETKLECTADHWRNAHLRQDWGDSNICNPEFLFGNNNVMRRSLVLSAGGYNELMRTNGEDADVSERIKSQGYKLVYEPTAVVAHKRQDTLSSILDTYWRYWRFGARAYLGESSIIDLFRYSIRHIAVDWVNAVINDVREKNYSLLWIDFLLPFYMICRDVEAYFSQNLESPQKLVVDEG